jgi:hypothetical protein
VIKKGFDTSGKLPAYLHHRKNHKARSGKIRCGLFHSEFRIGRQPHIAAPRLPMPRRLSAASELPSEPLSLNTMSIGRHARTCRPAAWPSPRPHAAPHDGIGFAPEMIAREAIMPHI